MSLKDDEFYLEEGKFVLTERFLWRRGYCCGNGCRHCPYDYDQVPPKTRATLEPPQFYFGQHPNRGEVP